MLICRIYGYHISNLIEISTHYVIDLFDSFNLILGFSECLGLDDLFNWLLKVCTHWLTFFLDFFVEIFKSSLTCLVPSIILTFFGFFDKFRYFLSKFIPPLDFFRCFEDFFFLFLLPIKIPNVVLKFISCINKVKIICLFYKSSPSKFSIYLGSKVKMRIFFSVLF